MWHWISIALAAAPIVEVLPDPEPARRARAPVDRRAVPFAMGRIVVDGLLDEPVWSEAAPGPPLGPFLEGPRPPAVVSRVVFGRTLALAVSGLPDGATATWVVDPDGTRTRWWRITVGERVAAEVCGFHADPVDGRVVLPSRAAPCETASVDAAGVEGAWEVAVPRDALGRVTNAMRLLLTVRGPDGAGGTWAPHGRTERVPELGRRVDTGPAPLRVRTAVQADGTWEVTLEGHAEPEWTLARHRGGTVVDTHAVDASTGQASTTLPALSGDVVDLEVRGAGDGPWVVADVVRVQPARARAWLLTPVVGQALELGYATPAGLSTDLVVRRGRRELLRVPVTLAEGSGRVRLQGSWRADAVSVALEGLLEPVTVRTSRRGSGAAGPR